MKKRSVSVMIFVNLNGEILVQKRGNYSKRGEDYAFFGGGIEEGESHQQTLVREMKEELNLNINIKECEYLGEFISENDDNSITIRHVYVQKTTKHANEFTVLEGECAEFVTIEKAKTLKFPSKVSHILEYLQLYLKNNLIVK